MESLALQGARHAPLAAVIELRRADPEDEQDEQRRGRPVKLRHREVAKGGYAAAREGLPSRENLLDVDVEKCILRGGERVDHRIAAAQGVHRVDGSLDRTDIRNAASNELLKHTARKGRVFAADADEHRRIDACVNIFVDILRQIDRRVDCPFLKAVRGLLRTHKNKLADALHRGHAGDEAEGKVCL